MVVKKNNVISSFSKKKIVGSFIALALGVIVMTLQNRKRLDAKKKILKKVL